MRTAEAATAALALAAWVAAVYRRPRQDRCDLSAWALPATLAALAAGLTLRVPAVYAAIGDSTGVANLGQLLKLVLVVASAFGTQVVLLHMLHPAAAARPRVRRRVLATAVTVLGMVVSFAASAPAADGVGVVRARLAEPGLVELRVLYLLFMAWAFWDITRLCLRFAGLADDRPLAAGLRLIAAGGAVGLVYVATSALQVLAAAQGQLTLVFRAQRIGDGLIALATLLVVSGSVLPAAVSRLAGTARPVTLHEPRQRDAAAALQRLWEALTHALPEVVLPVAHDHPLTPQERAYRQMIEIEDARLALRPWRDATLERAALQAARQRVSDIDEHGPAAEAAALALALARRAHAGASQPLPWAEAGSVGTHAGQAASHADQPGPDGGRDDVAWLSAVGRWWSDTQLIEAAARALDPGRTSTAEDSSTKARATSADTTQTEYRGAPSRAH